MAFYGREDDVFDSEEKLGPDMAKCESGILVRLWTMSHARDLTAA